MMIVLGFFFITEVPRDRGKGQVVVGSDGVEKIVHVVRLERLLQRETAVS